MPSFGFGSPETPGNRHQWCTLISGGGRCGGEQGTGCRGGVPCGGAILRALAPLASDALPAVAVEMPAIGIYDALLSRPLEAQP